MVVQINEATLQLKKAAAAMAPAQAIPPLAGNPFFPAEFAMERVEADGEATVEAAELGAAPEPEPVVEMIIEQEPLPELTGVLLQGRRSIAILDGEYFHVGERKGDFTVAEIQERRVLLKHGDEQHWVDVIKPDPTRKPAVKPSVKVEAPEPEKEVQAQ
jgi:hypothetical protein